jgi:Leucine-rich repeat (LRR) protein
MCVICKNEIDQTTINIRCESCPELTTERLKKSLGKCENLKLLNCGGCPKISSLNGLENCKKLERLFCHNCPLLISLDSVGDLKELIEIYCVKCPLLSSLEPLKNCDGLQSLFCCGCPLLTSIEPLKKCKSIRELYCSECPWLEYENDFSKNPDFPSNIKKLKILQRSCRKFLFRKRTITKLIFKSL